MKAFITGAGKKIALVGLGEPGGRIQASIAPEKAVNAPRKGPSTRPNIEAIKASMFMVTLVAPMALIPGKYDKT